MQPRLIRLIVTLTVAIGVLSVGLYNILSRGSAVGPISGPPTQPVAAIPPTPAEAIAARLRPIVDEYAKLDLRAMPTEQTMDVTGRKVVVIDMDRHALDANQQYLDDALAATNENDVGLVVYKRSVTNAPNQRFHSTAYFYAVAHPERKVVAADKTPCIAFATPTQIEAFVRKLTHAKS